MTKMNPDQMLGQYIPLHYHFNMMRDAARMNGFKEALQKVVPQGGRVLELGGGTGILSFFAASRASKVWCVEKNPQMVQAAKQFISLNPHSERIEVIEADAMEYLPPEPVDVVLCEMLHVGLLREKQVQVIESFKDRYRKAFGQKLPIFVPEASILAVQPVQQSFNFSGFYAPAPFFYDPLVVQNETQGLADPFNYQMVVYSQDLASRYECDATILIQTPGIINALRFITKNAIAILVEEKRTVDWFSQYLIIPTPQPITVRKGDQVQVTFSYRPGEELEALASTLKVSTIALKPLGQKAAV